MNLGAWIEENGRKPRILVNIQDRALLGRVAMELDFCDLEICVDNDSFITQSAVDSDADLVLTHREIPDCPVVQAIVTQDAKDLKGMLEKMLEDLT